MAAISRPGHTLPACFVLYWAVATAIGLSVGLVGLTYVGLGVDTALSGRGLGIPALATLVVLALAYATPLGIGQWLVLRRAHLEMRSWIPATTIGFILGVAPLLQWFWKGRGPLGLSDPAALGGLLGASIGFAQWVSLRRRVKRSSWWILGTTAASASAFALSTLPSPMLWSLPPTLQLLPVLAGPALFGATTGLLLRRLVADSRGGK